MTLIPGSDGALAGSYESLVGHAVGCYALAGRFDPSPPPDQYAALGWVVVWTNDHGNEHSVTTWCGRYDPNADLLHATWLLTAEGSVHTGWCSTHVGQDIFRRVGTVVHGTVGEGGTDAVH